jgi:hypothetical protein
MELVLELKQKAQTLPIEQFESKYSGLFLLGTLPLAEADEWTYTTGIQAYDSRTPERSLSSLVAPPQRLLWRLEKSDRNDWKRRISVGRAPNNDIVIRHESVSKLHAHFHHDSGFRINPFTPRELFLSDVGTVNGTLLDGRRLEKGESVAVKSGCRVQFGQVACELFDAKALYPVIKILRL